MRCSHVFMLKAWPRWGLLALQSMGDAFPSAILGARPRGSCTSSPLPPSGAGRRPPAGALYLPGIISIIFGAENLPLWRVEAKAEASRKWSGAPAGAAMPPGMCSDAGKAGIGHSPQSPGPGLLQTASFRQALETGHHLSRGRAWPLAVHKAAEASSSLQGSVRSTGRTPCTLPLSAWREQARAQDVSLAPQWLGNLQVLAHRFG